MSSRRGSSINPQASSTINHQSEGNAQLMEVFDLEGRPLGVLPLAPGLTPESISSGAVMSPSRLVLPTSWPQITPRGGSMSHSPSGSVAPSNLVPLNTNRKIIDSQHPYNAYSGAHAPPHNHISNDAAVNSLTEMFQEQSFMNLSAPSASSSARVPRPSHDSQNDSHDIVAQTAPSVALGDGLGVMSQYYIPATDQATTFYATAAGSADRLHTTEQVRVLAEGRVKELEKLLAMEAEKNRIAAGNEMTLKKELSSLKNDLSNALLRESEQRHQNEKELLSEPLAESAVSMLVKPSRSSALFASPLDMQRCVSLAHKLSILSIYPEHVIHALLARSQPILLSPNESLSTFLDSDVPSMILVVDGLILDSSNKVRYVTGDSIASESVFSPESSSSFSSFSAISSAAVLAIPSALVRRLSTADASITGNWDAEEIARVLSSAFVPNAARSRVRARLGDSSLAAHASLVRALTVSSVVEASAGLSNAPDSSVNDQPVLSHEVVLPPAVRPISSLYLSLLQGAVRGPVSGGGAAPLEASLGATVRALEEFFGAQVAFYEFVNGWRSPSETAVAADTKGEFFVEGAVLRVAPSSAPQLDGWSGQMPQFLMQHCVQLDESKGATSSRGGRICTLEARNGRVLVSTDTLEEGEARPDPLLLATKARKLMIAPLTVYLSSGPATLSKRSGGEDGAAQPHSERLLVGAFVLINKTVNTAIYVDRNSRRSDENALFSSEGPILAAKFALHKASQRYQGFPSHRSGSDFSIAEEVAAMEFLPFTERDIEYIDAAVTQAADTLTASVRQMEAILRGYTYDDVAAGAAAEKRRDHKSALDSLFVGPQSLSPSEGQDNVDTVVDSSSPVTTSKPLKSSLKPSLKVSAAPSTQTSNTLRVLSVRSISENLQWRPRYASINLSPDVVLAMAGLSRGVLPQKDVFGALNDESMLQTVISLRRSAASALQQRSTNAAALLLGQRAYSDAFSLSGSNPTGASSSSASGAALFLVPKLQVLNKFGPSEVRFVSSTFSGNPGRLRVAPSTGPASSGDADAQAGGVGLPAVMAHGLQPQVPWVAWGSRVEWPVGAPFADASARHWQSSDVSLSSLTPTSALVIRLVLEQEDSELGEDPFVYGDSEQQGNASGDLELFHCVIPAFRGNALLNTGTLTVPLFAGPFKDSLCGYDFSTTVTGRVGASCGEFTVDIGAIGVDEGSRVILPDLETTAWFSSLHALIESNPFEKRAGSGVNSYAQHARLNYGSDAPSLYDALSSNNNRPHGGVPVSDMFAHAYGSHTGRSSLSSSAPGFGYLADPDRRLVLDAVVPDPGSGIELLSTAEIALLQMLVGSTSSISPRNPSSRLAVAIDAWTPPALSEPLKHVIWSHRRDLVRRCGAAVLPAICRSVPVAFFTSLEARRAIQSELIRLTRSVGPLPSQVAAGLAALSEPWMLAVAAPALVPSLHPRRFLSLPRWGISFPQSKQHEGDSVLLEDLGALDRHLLISVALSSAGSSASFDSSSNPILRALVAQTVAPATSPLFSRPLTETPHLPPAALGVVSLLQALAVAAPALRGRISTLLTAITDALPPLARASLGLQCAAAATLASKVLEIANLPSISHGTVGNGNDAASRTISQTLPAALRVSLPQNLVLAPVFQVNAVSSVFARAASSGVLRECILSVTRRLAALEGIELVVDGQSQKASTFPPEQAEQFVQDLENSAALLFAPLGVFGDETAHRETSSHAKNLPNVFSFTEHFKNVVERTLVSLRQRCAMQRAISDRDDAGLTEQQKSLMAAAERVLSALQTEESNSGSAQSSTQKIDESNRVPLSSVFVEDPSAPRVGIPSITVTPPVPSSSSEPSSLLDNRVLYKNLNRSDCRILLQFPLAAAGPDGDSVCPIESDGRTVRLRDNIVNLALQVAPPTTVLTEVIHAAMLQAIGACWRHQGLELGDHLLPGPQYLFPCSNPGRQVILRATLFPHGGRTLAEVFRVDPDDLLGVVPAAYQGPELQRWFLQGLVSAQQQLGTIIGASSIFSADGSQLHHSIEPATSLEEESESELTDSSSLISDSDEEDEMQRPPSRTKQLNYRRSEDRNSSSSSTLHTNHDFTHYGAIVHAFKHSLAAVVTITYALALGPRRPADIAVARSGHVHLISASFTTGAPDSSLSSLAWLVDGATVPVPRFSSRALAAALLRILGSSNSHLHSGESNVEGAVGGAVPVEVGQFLALCGDAFLTIRRSALTIEALVAHVGAFIPLSSAFGCQGLQSARDIACLKARFFLHLSEEEALARFNSILLPFLHLE